VQRLCKNGCPKIAETLDLSEKMILDIKCRRSSVKQENDGDGKSDQDKQEGAGVSGVTQVDESPPQGNGGSGQDKADQNQNRQQEPFTEDVKDLLRKLETVLALAEMNEACSMMIDVM